jgi:hypothetical protein
MGGEPADEVDVHGVGRAIKRFGYPQQFIGSGSAGNQRYRRHGDSVVDDRQPEFLGDFRADAPQVACDFLYLVIDVPAHALATVAYAIQQADADSDGADVELLRPHHVDSFENLLAGEIEMAHLSIGPLRYMQTRALPLARRRVRDRRSS